MKLFWLAFAQCLARLAWVVPTTLAGAAIGARAGGQLRVEDDANAVALWLHLPLFATVLVASACAVESWPLFARARPGADWIGRLRPGPWRGCGAHALGALAAAALGCICIGAAAPMVVSGLPAPRQHVDLAQHGDLQVLAGATEQVEFTLPDGHSYDALLLRPRAFLPTAELVPTTLAVFGDGAPMASTAIEVSSTDQLVRVAFPPRPLARLQLRRTGGTVPLAFPPGSVVAITAAPHSRTGNAILGALVYLLPMFTALGAAVAGARALALPFGLLLLLLLLLVLTLGGLAPTGDAIAALLRGRWLIGEGVFRAGLPSLGAGVVAMILGMQTPRRGAR